jgi:hypothetical protein
MKEGHEIRQFGSCKASQNTEAGEKTYTIGIIVQMLGLCVGKEGKAREKRGVAVAHLGGSM